MSGSALSLSFHIRLNERCALTYPCLLYTSLSLIPLEKKLLTNFDLSKFVVCTDAGLSSSSNRKFNDDIQGNRAFVTTQSIKKLKKHLKTWALDTEGWLLAGEIPEPGQKPKPYSLTKLDPVEDKEKIYYRSRWIKDCLLYTSCCKRNCFYYDKRYVN